MSTPPMTYLALGDSYTIGESVRVSERWPVQLVAQLKGAGVEVGDPKIIATTGWTTDELKAGIEKAGIAGQQFDMVSLLIGVNNQYRDYPREQYLREFEELLKMAINFAGGNNNMVFVVSIPDYGVTPFGQEKDPDKIARELDDYNAINREFAEQYAVDYYDITAVSREALQDPELVADDKLHPSGKMYKQWVDLIFPGVKSALNSNN